MDKRKQRGGAGTAQTATTKAETAETETTRASGAAEARADSGQAAAGGTGAARGAAPDGGVAAGSSRGIDAGSPTVQSTPASNQPAPGSELLNTQGAREMDTGTAPLDQDPAMTPPIPVVPPIPGVMPIPGEVAIPSVVSIPGILPTLGGNAASTLGGDAPAAGPMSNQETTGVGGLPGDQEGLMNDEPMSGARDSFAARNLGSESGSPAEQIGDTPRDLPGPQGHTESDMKESQSRSQTARARSGGAAGRGSR